MGEQKRWKGTDIIIHNTVPRHYVQARIDDGAEEVGTGWLWEMLVSIAWGVGGRRGRLSVWALLVVRRNRFQTEGNESNEGVERRSKCFAAHMTFASSGSLKGIFNTTITRSNY
jgi:hypothetical protein